LPARSEILTQVTGGRLRTVSTGAHFTVRDGFGGAPAAGRAREVEYSSRAGLPRLTTKADLIVLLLPLRFAFTFPDRRGVTVSTVHSAAAISPGFIDNARESLSRAIDIAQTMSSTMAEPLIAGPREAFMAGYHTMIIVSIAILGNSAAISAFVLRTRRAGSVEYGGAAK